MRKSRDYESERTLFEARSVRGAGTDAAAPLAERMRPKTLDGILGQDHLLGEGRPLRLAIENDRVPSMILWGPPGSGKTTLARVVAEHTQGEFVPFNAVLGGIPELRDILSAARERRRFGGKRTILFVDEIHRFNRSQQDAFLPDVENGTVTLIGATTENPSFSINAPLLSRCKVHVLKPMDAPQIALMLRRASEDLYGLGQRFRVEEEALEVIANLAQGDARRALTILELASGHAERSGATEIKVSTVAALNEQKTLLYDKAGEEHYNVVSAFIKSMRGSDPDATIYWMMRMLEAGDDPLFVLRRMIIFASEDIGNADPRGLEIAVAADHAFRRLGMPEGLYPMAHAAIYLAAAPKSNAVNLAWHKAQQAVREWGSLPVPLKLRNPVTKGMKDLGYGSGYRYAHSEPNAIASGETYLPDELVNATFYEPTERGYEKTIAERLRHFRSK